MLSVNSYWEKDRRGMLLHSSKQTRIGSFVRFFSNRSVCFVFLILLCSLSLMATFTRLTTHPTPISVRKWDSYDAYRFIEGQPIKQYRQLRTRDIMAMTRNEKDSALRHLNTNGIKSQGLLTLRKKQTSSRRKLKDQFQDVVLNIASNTKPMIVAEPAPQHKSELVSTVAPTWSNGEAKLPLITEAPEVFRNMKNDSVEKLLVTKTVDKQNPSLQNDKPKNESLVVKPIATMKNKTNSIKHEDLVNYEHYRGDLENLMALDFSNEIDPIRASFLRNVSRFAQSRKKRMGNYYKKEIPLLPQQKTGIILVTNYRSGSTFLGELFNQHPDSFYIFEPLFPFTGGCEVREPAKAKLLYQLLKCEFPEMLDVYTQVKGKLRRGGEDVKCLVDNFCFKFKTKEMCERDLCPFWSFGNCQKCGSVHLPRAMNACREKKMTVVKTIRLCDIMNLRPLLGDPELDFKIIHLIRDPRGIESSRSKIHQEWKFESDAESSCRRLLHNGQLGLANTKESKWLRDKYLRVRYEDLSLHPLEEAERIYKFANLEFLPEMKNWIAQNTHGLSSKKKFNPYSTKRDSASTMEAWRKHLKFPVVRTVQNVCKNMMDFFGYKTVDSLKELLNFDLKLVS
ncbi:unnamed protein product [Clavelina lepadiformis]|uniref:Sulfotransferase domain-containing protein n=1 Tax=Clavelina lepadiformis TaxID=159417 RepID=A0ABP0F1D5_CLALP